MAIVSKEEEKLCKTERKRSHTALGSGDDSKIIGPDSRILLYPNEE